jgi:hypothetical protein
MTKQHFEQVAEMFRTNRPSTSEDNPLLWPIELVQWETCVVDFASIAAQGNPRFDRARFMRACGYTR